MLKRDLQNDFNQLTAKYSPTCSDLKESFMYMWSMLVMLYCMFPWDKICLD